MVGRHVADHIGQLEADLSSTREVIDVTHQCCGSGNTDYWQVMAAKSLRVEKRLG